MLLCIVFISFVIVFNFKALILTIEIKDYFNSSLNNIFSYCLKTTEYLMNGVCHRGLK